MDMRYQGTVHSTNFMNVKEAIPHFNLKLDPEGMETAAATVENSMYVCVGRLVVSDCATTVDCSPQAPLSMGFSRQEDWSGLPFPSPGDLPGSPALQANSLSTELRGKPKINCSVIETKNCP